MLTIRFNRIGKRNKAQFRIVVQEHSVAPGGRHVEIVGSYDPHSKEGVFKSERIKYWIDKGAQISDSVYNLLIKKEVISGKKRAMNVRSKKKGKDGEEKTPADAPSSDKKAEDSSEEVKQEKVKDAESKAVEEKSTETKTEKE